MGKSYVTSGAQKNRRTDRQRISPAGWQGMVGRRAVPDDTGAPPAGAQQAPARVESKGQGKTQDQANGVCKQEEHKNGVIVKKEWTTWNGGLANLKKEAHNRLHEQAWLFNNSEKKSTEEHIRDTNSALEMLKETLHLNNPGTDRDWTIKLHKLTRGLEPYFAKREVKYNHSDKINPISVSYET